MSVEQVSGTLSGYALDKHLTGWLDDLAKPAPRGMKKWTPSFILSISLIVGALATIMLVMPNRFFDEETLRVTITLGLLGIWRFGWWFTHAIRAEIYQRAKWPKMRAKADKVWADGWRPRRLHIQMTTFFEEPAITKKVIGSLLYQIKKEGIPAVLWIGTGTPYDEGIITEFVRKHASDVDAELVFVRQNQPGKRMAIGLILRAISRYGIDPDDLVIFMDGDAVFHKDAVQKAASMFGADPDLQALTTNEEVLCYGPKWIQSWLTMRFAQRRLAMQSHAMSDKVLTLTGRMSMFRARHIVDPKFIRTIEADHLSHWLWGRFRFLSGDDKSTWYHMLTREAKMTYVPDAMVYTIEQIEGSGMERMVQNFRRWSGNMLRNGARAIALGPRKVKPFIWWCVVDQRLAMWTMMVSPVMAFLTLFIDPLYLVNALLWVAFSRTVLCIFLFRYARHPNLVWIPILYFNQLINASVKIFLIFHLSKQKWSNRGNQSAGAATSLLERTKEYVAKFQLLTTVTFFVWLLSVYMGLLPTPW